MPSGSPLAGLYSFELDPETELKHDCDMFDLMEQGVGGSALKTLSPVPKAAPHSRCYVKRVRDDNGQILFHMYKEGGGTYTLSRMHSRDPLLSRSHLDRRGQRSARHSHNTALALTWPFVVARRAHDHRTVAG